MSIKPIRLFGDPVLRTPAEPVTDFDAELRKLVKDLTDTMLDAPGSASRHRRSASACACSPTTSTTSSATSSTRRCELSDEEETDDEGCLSVPGLAYPTHAPTASWPRASTCTASRSRSRAAGQLARCVQHETDHLDGVLFIDRLDAAQRKLAMKEIRAAEWWGEPVPAVQGLAALRPTARRSRPCAWSSLARRPRRCRRWTPCWLAGTRSSRCVTRPDAPAGRGRQWPASPVAERARTGGHRGAAARPPDRGRFLARLREIAPDCCPVIAYGALIPQAALDIPAHGWVNLHFSLLPAWRGAAPVQHAHPARRRHHRRDHLPARRGAGRRARSTACSPSRSGPPTRRRPAGPAGVCRRGPAGRDPGRDRVRRAGGACRSPPTGSASRRRSPPTTPEVNWKLPAAAVDRLIRACTPAPGAWTDCWAGAGGQARAAGRGRPEPADGAG